MSTPEIVRRVLEEAGVGDQHLIDIHSWRCAYPGLYGQCSCFEALAKDLQKAIISSMTVETDLRIVPADTNGGKYETRTYRRYVTEWKPDE